MICSWILPTSRQREISSISRSVENKESKSWVYQETVTTTHKMVGLKLIIVSAVGVAFLAILFSFYMVIEGNNVFVFLFNLFNC